nr:hypothetical protein [Amycolatopsis xylanica]
MSDRDPVVNIVTAIAATVIALSFLFGFGNVLNLALRLGVSVWIAPLVAPAVDLSVLGLLLAVRHLVLQGAATGSLRPARRLLLFASMVTLALNAADPLVTGHVGKAAFDAVGPLLLIGWAEVGPDLLLKLNGQQEIVKMPGSSLAAPVRAGNDAIGELELRDDLLPRAKEEDALHRSRTQRPISAEVLRGRLGIGAARARMLVKVVRSEYEVRAGDS